jgi:YD repeat-containing protein
MLDLGGGRRNRGGQRGRAHILTEWVRVDGVLHTETNELSKTVAYAYDANGNVVTKTDRERRGELKPGRS